MQIAGLVITLNFIFMIVISPSIADERNLEDCYDSFEADTDEIGEIDSNALATHYTTNWRAKLLDILYYLMYGYEEEPVPEQQYVCVQNTPVNPQWTTTVPIVFWSHILCGQICIRNGRQVAMGFHSRTATTNWNQCVRAPDCRKQTDGNENCSPNTVEIYNFNTGTWIFKGSRSTLFNPSMTGTTLINHLVRIYNACRPPAGSRVLCAKGCNYQGNSFLFDIKIAIAVRGANRGGIVTAYPVLANTCTERPQCSNQCTNL